MSQLTLSIIKPDAVKKHCIGGIYTQFEHHGLHIVAAKMMHLSKHQASHFYAIHADKPFFQDLVTFMSSGPILVQVLSGDNAIAKNREIMGHTDPKKAAPNTLRAMFGSSIDENAVHGSDSEETAQREIAFFFSQQEICYVCNG